MASRTSTTAENSVETKKVEETVTETEKAQETAKIEAVETTFIYIGPTLGTGLRKNAVFKGTRESVEKHLEKSFEKYPQAKLLLVVTEKLAEAKAKTEKAGTILNKYYKDLESLSRK